MGVRPEDVYLEGAAMLPPDIVFAEAVIDAVEPMGNEVVRLRERGHERVVGG